jgi:hypothetical protein
MMHALTQINAANEARKPADLIARFDRIGCSCHVLRIMAAANASARGQRVAILASPLSELAGFKLTVGCLSPGCAGRSQSHIEPDFRRLVRTEFPMPLDEET